MKTGQILKQKSEVLLDKGEQMLSIQTTDGCLAQVDEEIILNEIWSSEVRPEGPHSKKAAEWEVFKPSPSIFKIHSVQVTSPTLGVSIVAKMSVGDSEVLPCCVHLEIVLADPF